MDTIDSNTLSAAAHEVERLAANHGLAHIHTVIITLNGSHGGADLEVIGFEGNDVSLYNQRRFGQVLR